MQLARVRCLPGEALFHKKFVQNYKWIDEQLYQELFALSQALPEPASTKMLFCINYIHENFLAGVGTFALWCLPGAIGMYVLSLGVSRIGEELPSPVYALLSGLNAAMVGVIAVAAVQLSEKAITDKLTRTLVFLGGVAGMLYTALWYFPVLMATSGLATVVWDYKWLQRVFKPFWRRRRAFTQRSLHLRRILALELASGTEPEQPDGVLDSDLSERIIPLNIQLKPPQTPTLSLSPFSNLYLAGTIIIGGGPVVIPLLREYIVSSSWVSPRNFLLGLALIQSFPGPNFNFAVYLGALSLPSHSFLSAAIGFLGIFTPGIIIVTRVMGLWKIEYVDGENQTVTSTSFVGGAWFELSAPLAILLGGVMGMG
ncbi:hypothetical protein BDZ45DRAFT_767344 [Acephala macrosclerotiorum]|nr:hypothetical protein BDZ45DRAFT_767344 [Acephala macrosclerotiorum]